MPSRPPFCIMPAITQRQEVTYTCQGFKPSPLAAAMTDVQGVHVIHDSSSSSTHLGYLCLGLAQRRIHSTSTHVESTGT